LLDGVALAEMRLAVVDLASPPQPFVDAETGVAVVLCGQVSNHVELRLGLESSREFRTRTDTEVVLAAFLKRGMACVDDFVGQFALAIFDPRDQTLWLARDRVGAEPLHYALVSDGLCFASEAKAILSAGWVAPALDARAVLESSQLWSPVSPRSMFRGIQTLEPGHIACFRNGRLSLRKYWDFNFADDVVDGGMSEASALDSIDEVLGEAVRLGLRADVPVAAYLSGGLDSSIVCALAQKRLGGALQTYSVGFAQARYDEQQFQQAVASTLHTQHHVVQVSDADIGALLPSVVYHGEQMLLRSTPGAMFALSRLVHQHQTRVVLSGEGADELFLGYDLFKETAIRRFCSRAPESRWRARLFSRLYPYLPVSQQKPEILREIFGAGLDAPAAFEFSHQIRWSNSGRIARFFSQAFRDSVDVPSPVESLRQSLPADVSKWRPLARAQYLELKTLLAGYVLGAQGDRMMAAHSVSGRFPFLDHRVIELSARLPDTFKLRGLVEKRILRRYALGRVPRLVLDRPKFPFRAPIAEALTGERAPAWCKDLLTKTSLEKTGVFEPVQVARLLAKLSRRHSSNSEADNMSIMAVVSLQLLAHQFIHAPRTPRTEDLDGVSIEAA
jgi:asparagine synthase (glutamine-hydrolysing)